MGFHNGDREEVIFRSLVKIPKLLSQKHYCKITFYIKETRVAFIFTLFMVFEKLEVEVLVF